MCRINLRLFTIDLDLSEPVVVLSVKAKLYDA